MRLLKGEICLSEAGNANASDAELGISSSDVLMMALLRELDGDVGIGLVVGKA